MSSLGPLEDGGRVIIIGGGPAGVACALALQRLGADSGRRVMAVIVEGKEFEAERHFNPCVGVLSPPLPALLESELGAPFPHHLARSYIRGYILHSGQEQILLEDPEARSVALRRVQFDAYMFNTARERGISVLPARAIDLEFHDDHVVVYTESTPLEGEVVVGAFGMDEGSATFFARQTDYREPWTLASVLTKYHPGYEAMTAFGPYIHAFLPREPRIEFGAVTPKGNHLTINIAGAAVDSRLMEAFLQYPAVKEVLIGWENACTIDPNDLRYFKGRFPCCRAHHYYGDRFVITGDAAGLVRVFKGKGVTSAMLSGIRAARTILNHGISGRAFHEHYRKANLEILQDRPYGRLVRLLTIGLARIGKLDAVVRAARNDPRLQRALFDAVSAHAPYREVLASALNPASMLSILKASV